MLTTYDIDGQTWNGIDITEGAMLPILVGELDHTTSFNLNNGAIAEPYGVAHTRVEVAECLPSACHMVGLPCVEDPSPRLTVSIASEESEDRLLH
jgi:hypothetical protein